MKKKIVLILSIAIFLGGLIIYYLNYENTSLIVSNYEIKNNKIPNEFNTFKIVQISDFHNTQSDKLTNNLITQVKLKKPNIIVITGDLIDSNKTDIERAINFVKELKSVAPIYFVLGNHESKGSYYIKLKEELTKNNVIILDNKVDVIQIGDSKLNLLGINDPSVAHEASIPDEQIIKTELSNIKYDNKNYSILLSHRPEVFNIYVENKIDLVLTGHAHGGQIRIPFIGGVVAPNQGFFPKYTRGIFTEDETTMIVSRGIGNSILPFRINNRPELVVIELKSE